jgi:chromosome segregation ATPase
MSPRKLTPLIVLGMLLSGMVVHAADAPTIKKCKDATGRWHYGDSAADECAKSKVTVMTDAGTTKKVIAAPPTEQELKQREAQRETMEAERTRAEDQARKDALLLSTYGVEDDILYIRDRKIAQIESQIKASEETLKSLRGALARMEAQAKDEGKDAKAAETTAKNIALTQSQIARHEGAIAAKRQEQQALRQQYASELQRYRELKKKTSAKTPPTAAKN